MTLLPTPTNYIRLNMYLPTRRNSKISIPIRSNSPRGLRNSKRLHIKHSYIPRRRFRRRIQNDL